MMTEAENELLMQCAYARGLAGTEKAASTENLYSFYERGLAPQTDRPRTSESKDSKKENNNNTKSPEPLRPYTRSGRTPSPRVVSRKFQRTFRRAKSAMPFVHLGSSRPSSSMSEESSYEKAYSHYSKASGNTMDKAAANYIRNRRKSTFPHLDGGLNVPLTKRTGKQIYNTLMTLSRMTGYGDSTTIIARQVDERHFTDADYSKTTRYPQSIRVAPQLTQIIKGDIKSRMGQPRRKLIKERDVRIWNEDQPPLGRTHRNLIIFDWLVSIDEFDYEMMNPPPIEDLEGVRPKTRSYPTLVPGIVGEDDDGFTGFSFSRGRSTASGRLSGSPFLDDDSEFGDCTRSSST